MLLFLPGAWNLNLHKRCCVQLGYCCRSLLIKNSKKKSGHLLFLVTHPREKRKISNPPLLTPRVSLGFFLDAIISSRDLGSVSTLIS